MPRPTGIFKKSNDYQQAIDPVFFEKCPKAVFAAIAVSYAVNWAGIPFEQLTDELKKEWETLYKNGIVPQKPAN